MTLDVIIFDYLFFYQFVNRILRAKVSVRSRIFDVVLIRLVVKGEVFKLT